jgi:hypothetical protein
LIFPRHPYCRRKWNLCCRFWGPYFEERSWCVANFHPEADHLPERELRIRSYYSWTCPLRSGTHARKFIVWFRRRISFFTIAISVFHWKKK